MQIISESLKILRKNKGFTQRELSEKIGVTEQAVSKWERGKSYPSIDTIQALINILDCSPNDLFGYTEGEKNYNRINMLRVTEKIEASITPDVILLEIGEKLVELFTDESCQAFKGLQDLRVIMAQQFGIILPMIRIRDIVELDVYDYRICIGRKKISSNTIYPSMMWGCDIEASDGDIVAINPITGLSIVWTEREEEYLTSPAQTIVSHLEQVILNNFDRIISLQYVSDIIEIIAKKNPIIKSHIVPHRVSFQLIKKVLTKLVIEKKCRINDLVYIIETIDDVKDVYWDVDKIVELVSEGLEKFSC